MRPNPNLPPAPAASQSGAHRNDADRWPTPPWWSADRERLDALIRRRQEIYRRDQAMTKKAQSAGIATVLAAISVYSADAAGAVVIPMGRGFLVLFVALLLVSIAAWLIDDRLVQQIRDVRMRSQLWLDLVHAVRQGCIDVTQLHASSCDETEAERLLRKEVAVAAQYQSSEATLAPHLPIFGHCFTLQKA